MPIKHKDHETMNMLWVAVTVLVGILMGVLSTYMNLQPKVTNLQEQGVQFQTVIQEQNRQIASLRSQAQSHTSFNGPIGAQNANLSAASRHIPTASGLDEALSKAGHGHVQSTPDRPQATLTTQPQATPVAQSVANTPAPVKQAPPAVAPETSIVSPPPPTAQNGPAKAAPAKEIKPAQKDKAPPKQQPATTKEPSKAVASNDPAKPKSEGLHPDAKAALVHRDAQPAPGPTPNPAPTAQTDDPQPGKTVVKATMGQANIAGMDGASVTFKTGLRVQVGSQFPSGERLLSVSPGARKIETDRRVIHLQLEDATN